MSWIVSSRNSAFNRTFEAPLSSPTVTNDVVKGFKPKQPPMKAKIENKQENNE